MFLDLRLEAVALEEALIVIRRKEEERRWLVSRASLLSSQGLTFLIHRKRVIIVSMIVTHVLHLLDDMSHFKSQGLASSVHVIVRRRQSVRHGDAVRTM